MTINRESQVTGTNGGGGRGFTRCVHTCVHTRCARVNPWVFRRCSHRRHPSKGGQTMRLAHIIPGPRKNASKALVCVCSGIIVLRYSYRVQCTRVLYDMRLFRSLWLEISEDREREKRRPGSNLSLSWMYMYALCLCMRIDRCV